MAENTVAKMRDTRIMDRWSETQLVDWAAGTKGDVKTKDALRQELADVAADLAGPNPTPVEANLARAAALCWFAWRLYEANHASAATSDRGVPLAQGDYQQRRIDRAHRRYLATLKTLATVRRLALPALQVNLARQQVNIANGSGAAGGA